MNRQGSPQQAAPGARRPAPLADSVFYHVYPQSFADSNGDGIGDLRGITDRLDYLSWLGVDVVWLSPVFVSPFQDAGYDIADYYAVAPRYGDLDSLVDLVERARRLKIKILLDLVAGHTSVEHPWFLAASEDPGDDRYIWSPNPGPEFVASPGRRPRFFLKNFLPCQPALNYGYARPHPDEPWRSPTDAPGPVANRAAMVDVMDFWLRLGVAGFRCDMAHSLVKDDPDQSETAKAWRDMRAHLDRRHPDAILLSEWGNPRMAVRAGFDADFLLHYDSTVWRSLFDNGRAVQLGHYPPVEACFFDADGAGSATEFTSFWQATATAIADQGSLILATGNHDYARLGAGRFDPAELKAAFAMVLTWPAVPEIYYGDEIGLRFLDGLPNVEGSSRGPTANRAGCRAPMIWDDTPSRGFSAAAADRLYLPQDPDPQRPSVATQAGDKQSLLSTVRALIALRRERPDLGTRGGLRVLNAGYPLLYQRGDRHLVVVNPRRDPVTWFLKGASSARPLLAEGVRMVDDRAVVDGNGWGIFEVDGPGLDGTTS